MNAKIVLTTSLAQRLILAVICCTPLWSIADDNRPADIGVVEAGAGRLFVGPRGFTLYTYKRDGEQPGASVCIDACAEAWPPVVVAEGATAVGHWSVIERPDGSQQWAHKSMPVYRYAKDTHPGATNGEKASGFWDVLFEPMPTPAGIEIAGTTDGQILTDLNGNPAYAHATGNCDAACKRDWRPLEAPWLANPINADWTIVLGDDGLAQWAFQNQPLFTYHGHQINNAAHADNGWQLVVLQPAPELPQWVTIQDTDFGPVLADENRMTLYYIVSDQDAIKRQTCDAECEETHWQPVLAPADTKPIGNWSTRQLADGTYQWVYLGLRVFTYPNDALPGDINGDKFASGANIRAGWQAIRKETLVQKLF